MDVKPGFLLSLSCHGSLREGRTLPSRGLGQRARPVPGDERHLPRAVPFFDAAHLPFPHHVHDLISLQGSPGALHRKEAQSRIDASFDEAVILFDDIVEILDLPQATAQTDSRHPLLILLQSVATTSRLRDGSDGSTSQFLAPTMPVLLQ